MIEQIMYIGIGFLVAGLLVIGVIPLVHGRAVRLTTRRLQALNPVSVAEIQAQKDQLRAEFAMSTRRLEMSLDQLKAKTATQLAELSKKNDAISRLKFELGEKAAALLALEAKEKQLSDELDAVSADRSSKATALEEAQRSLATAQAELAELTTTFHAKSVAAESEHVELVAEHAQIEALKGQIEAYRIEVEDVRQRLSSKESEVDLLRERLAADRAGALDTVHAENAALRDQINEVAAEIARLTGALEGPDSPIASILGSEPPSSETPVRGANGGGVRPNASLETRPQATLADRIRALQSRASRINQRSRA